MQIKFPKNKSFAFTIIDDTDDAFLENIKPIYDLLNEHNILITKTVWVYPPRDSKYSKGDCLQRGSYLNYINKIIKYGFEVGLHNVGSGKYFREEILKGLADFKQKLGFYPKIHVNHSYNKDNIYCGSKRFSFPINYLVKFLYSHYDDFFGDDPNSSHFWGDLHKKHIKYSRNLEVDNVNTLKIVPLMPYVDPKYSQFSNYWYASTFAPNQWVFNKIINEKSIDKLESENGVCILYTHLGYYVQDGIIDPGFVHMIKYISRKENGWFAPVSEILDFLHLKKQKDNMSDKINILHLKFLELHSLYTRIKYRYIIKIDDFHFKKSLEYIKNKIL